MKDKMLLSLLLFGLFFNVFGNSFSDDHSDGELNGWTIYGQRPWSETDGSALPADANPNEGFLINDYECTDDGIIEVNMTADQWNGNRAGVVFRWTDVNSYYYVAVLPGNRWSNHLIFNRNSMSIETATIVAQNDIDMGTTFDLRVEIEGNTFRFYVNDTYRGEITDDTHPSGGVGYAQSAEWNRYNAYNSIAWTDVSSGYNLSVETEGQGSVDPSSGQYSEGDTVTVTATADPGWTFSHWSGSLTGTDNPLIFNIDSDVELTAHFIQLPTYSLTINIVGEGEVIADSGTFYEGDTVSLYAQAAQGWIFSTWDGDLSGFINPATILMDEDKTITAYFSEHLYSLYINTEGSGTVDPDSGRFPFGDTVTIIATPLPGNAFTGWSGDLTGNENPATVIIDTNKSITANFEELTFDLSVTTEGSGTVTPDSGTFSYGDSVTLTATPDAGWFFYGWSGDISGDENPVTIIMDSDKSVEARFVQNFHQLTVDIFGNGTVTPDSGSFPEGDTVMITATASPGYRFSHWDGDATGTDTVVSIVILSDITIEAYFEEIPTYTLSITSEGDGIAEPDSGEFMEGEIVRITAVPNPGWRFERWSGDIESTENPVMVQMNSDITATAHFIQTPVYEVIITAEEGGTVTPDTALVNEGDSLLITATPLPGYAFERWSGDITGSQNPISIIVESDMVITAHFVDYIPPVPNREKLSISAKIFDSEGNPVGESSADTLDVVIRLYNHPEEGAMRYEEFFLTSEEKGIIVTRGNLVARLGEGRSDYELGIVLSDNPHLWVEITIGDDSLGRIPLTGAAYDLSTMP
ncbi:hypothetical protein QA601_07255 [Chitinispirillales bacterium ANBcel5]|uniref:InlB B-repeat-containing protein n=1 Tax=Cellulosispirillum alkaliphilum TaxID=3039283 RepID=UPI002A58A19E|nr:hypothetical protein [Chitinispirillales bacterium ANBcel5]